SYRHNRRGPSRPDLNRRRDGKHTDRAAIVEHGKPGVDHRLLFVEDVDLREIRISCHQTFSSAGCVVITGGPPPCAWSGGPPVTPRSRNSLLMSLYRWIRFVWIPAIKL